MGQCSCWPNRKKKLKKTKIIDKDHLKSGKSRKKTDESEEFCIQCVTKSFILSPSQSWTIKQESLDKIDYRKKSLKNIDNNSLSPTLSLVRITSQDDMKTPSEYIEKIKLKLMSPNVTEAVKSEIDRLIMKKKGHLDQLYEKVYRNVNMDDDLEEANSFKSILTIDSSELKESFSK